MPSSRSYRFWSAVALAAAVWLAALLLGGPASRTDVAIFNALHAGERPELVAAAKILTRLGGWAILVPVGLFAVLYLAFQRRMRAGLLLIMIAGGRLLVEVQKTTLGRPRPFAPEHLVTVKSMSFVSAHAANSMITFLGIALLLPIPQRWRPLAIVVAVAFSLLIGASRVALGVHWPTDVLGGWAFGIAWILICVRLASAREPVTK